MFRSTPLNSLANNPLFLGSDVGESLSSQPLGFIDVGARGGAHDFVEPIAKLTAILGFEPDQAECERLMSNPAVYTPWADFHLEPVALAEKAGDAELVLVSSANNHSLLPPNTDFTNRYNMDKWLEIGREPLKTKTLDSLIFSNLTRHRWGELMKLDTQGTEYEILEGSIKTLADRTVAIITEVSFCELYRGQKLFSEVEVFMRSQGFSFYGFPKIHNRSCKLLDKHAHITAERALYADAIFFKDPLAGHSPKVDIDDRGIYVLFTSALLMGYYDFAQELAVKTWASTPSKKADICELISQLSMYGSEDATRAIDRLIDRVKQTPKMANIVVGSFVDERRRFCNYDDILNVSPLPKML
jgi:FkbM family methyltransferase